MPKTPRYTLVTVTDRADQGGDWEFRLQDAAGQTILEASDTEPDATGERLALLTVVRGLEALDEPARVSLVTASRYVKRGIAYGLGTWRTTDFTWESYGRMVPIKDQDLWRRLDRALSFHQLMCRRWRIDAPHAAKPRRPRLVHHAVDACDFADSGVSRPHAQNPPRRPSRWSKLLSGTERRRLSATA